MHFVKIKGSSLHQDGKGMGPFIKPLFKCFESKNFDNLNYILLIISLKKINYSLRVVVLCNQTCKIIALKKRKKEKKNFRL